MSLPTIDLKKFALLMLPNPLRQPRMVSIMSVLMRPMTTLNDKREKKRSDTLVSLRHNGQVCYLKDILNLTFLPDLESYSDGFAIENNDNDGVFVLAYEEISDYAKMHLMLSEDEFAILYSEDFIDDTVYSFTVFVPASLYSDKETDDTMKRIYSVVEQYRLVSRLPCYARKNV